MTGKFVKKINRSDRNLLTYLQEKGLTLQEIEYFVIDTLSPYISNKDFLNKQGANFLAFEACNIATFQDDPTWKSFFETILENYENSLREKSKFVIETMSGWNQSIYNGQRQTPQIFKLRSNPDELDLESLEYEVFRTIHTFIENCIKPYIGELLSIEKNWSREEVEEKDLGTLVNDLESGGIIPGDFCRPLPWGLKLHDWRNIAAHSNRKVEDKKIVCTYKKGRETIRLSRNDIQMIEIELSKRLAALKSAREIFIFNHFEEFSKSLGFKESFDAFELNVDIILLDLSYACLIRGLEIQDFDHKGQEITFHIKDLRQFEENIQTTIYKIIYFGLFQVVPHFEGKNIVLFYDIPESITTVKISIDGAAVKAYPEAKLSLRKLTKFVDIKAIPTIFNPNDTY